MAKTYNVMKINVKDEITDIIVAKQNDVDSHFLDVYFRDNGVPIDLTGHEVRIYGRKPDGTSFFNDGEITDAVNGRCQFPLTSQALAAIGKLEVELSIWENNDRILTTQTFIVFVTEKIRNDNGIESSNEFGALVILYQKLYDFIADVTELLNLVGQPADTGGTTLEGTVMAKINRLMSVAGVDNAWKIKSLQHGEVDIGNTGKDTMPRYITVNSVNVEKSILWSFFLKNKSYISAGGAIIRENPTLINHNTIRQYPCLYSNCNGFYYYLLEFE
ncbi:MAG: BppU family phage baseplate upper protein [Firmicutes bacterium]|nr:BppU family phage baseplate upper protein [Bacillota bacterium]